MCARACTHTHTHHKWVTRHKSAEPWHLYFPEITEVGQKQELGGSLHTHTQKKNSDIEEKLKVTSIDGPMGATSWERATNAYKSNYLCIHVVSSCVFIYMFVYEQLKKEPLQFWNAIDLFWYYWIPVNCQNRRDKISITRLNKT